MFRFRRSLQFHISFIFSVVVFFLSTLLIIAHYQNTKALTYERIQKETQQSAEIIELTFENKTLPLFVILNTLAESNFVTLADYASEKTWLKAIKSIFDSNHETMSFYLGFESERSIFYRKLDAQALRNRYNAPQAAVIMLEINEIDGKQERYFFNEELALIHSLVTHTQYLPTTRPWFIEAPLSGKIHISKPYRFYSSDMIGISISRRLLDGTGVISVDLNINSLDEFLNTLPLPDESKLLLINHEGEIIAQTNKSPRPKLDPETMSYINYLLQSSVIQTMPVTSQIEGEPWLINIIEMTSISEQSLFFVKLTPELVVFETSNNAINHQIITSIGIFITGLVLIFWVSNRIAYPLKQMTEATANVKNLKFNFAAFPRSNIKQIEQLSQSLETMSDTISRFLATLHQVSKSSDFDSLLNNIVHQSYDSTNADLAMMWGKDCPDDDQMTFITSYPKLNKQDKEENARIHFDEIRRYLAKSKRKKGSTKPFAFTPKNDENSPISDYERVWVFTLTNRQENKIGHVLLAFKRPLSLQEETKITFIQTFLDFVGLTIENRSNILERKRLFDAFVRVFASAIDTKSPYTGGHCQRVPAITFLLANAMEKDQKYFPDFMLDETARETLHLAAWLHDCGKVTTPEYVVDKSTKLETIYNRIHEIRTRFEVIKRDKMIAYLQTKIHPSKTEKSEEWLNKQLKKLDDDFAFIAECNLGSETFDEKNIQKLNKIAQTKWMRTIDDSLGLSWEEALRRKQRNEANVNVKESVLKDKVDHLVSWSDRQAMSHQTWPYSLTVPEHQFNQGELYNLSISYGTLTTEERFIINNHVIETLKMLETLPYPKYLKDIPVIASSHHEQLNGAGYPLGLKAKQLPLQSRILAIADIFEALTANDRPYKRAKPLSESLEILINMANKDHIDANLVRLFIESKIYVSYANEYLPKAHCDYQYINEAELLSKLKVKK